MSVVAFAPHGAFSRATPSMAPGSAQPRLLTFPPGESRLSIEGGVPRGSSDLYAVVAGAGQRLWLRLASIEDNAALRLYGPNVRIVASGYGTELCGRALTGEATVRNWNGRVPITGPYLIAVSPSWGGATYRLLVGIEAPAVSG